MALSYVENDAGHERCPAGLMTRPHAASRVSMEVLMERQQVAPVCIRLEVLIRPKNGTPAERITAEDTDDPPGDFVCRLFQIHKLVGTCRALNPQVRPVVFVQAPERLNQQVVHGQPDWTAPVGVSSKEPR